MYENYVSNVIFWFQVLEIELDTSERELLETEDALFLKIFRSNFFLRLRLRKVCGGLHETEEWGEFKEQIQAQPYFVRNSCCATNGITNTNANTNTNTNSNNQ